MKVFVHRPAGLGIVNLFNDIWFYALHAEMCAFESPVTCTLDPYASPWMAMGRNRAIDQFLAGDWEFLLMIDPDMVPDLYRHTIPLARPFFSSSAQFLRDKPKGIVGAPYCGPRPWRRIHVWLPRFDGTGATRCTQEEAAHRVKNPRIERVGAVGTGILLMDRAALEAIPSPHFHDVYSSPKNTALRMSFDVQFCDNALKADVPVWANWHAYAGHQQMCVHACPGVEVRDARGKVPSFLDHDPSVFPVDMEEARVDSDSEVEVPA